MNIETEDYTFYDLSLKDLSNIIMEEQEALIPITGEYFNPLFDRTILKLSEARKVYGEKTTLKVALYAAMTKPFLHYKQSKEAPTKREKGIYRLLAGMTFCIALYIKYAHDLHATFTYMDDCRENNDQIPLLDIYPIEQD